MLAIRRGHTDVIRLLVVLAAAVLLAASPHDVTAQFGRGLAAPGGVQVDTTYGSVGEWFALRTPSGDVMQYSEFRGRVLFVNFWATWCAPCVKEMPTIAELAEAMEDTEVAFLLISIDEERREFERFVKKRGLEHLSYLRAWEEGVSSFEGGMVPATFIVDKHGKIVYRHHGAANWNTESIRRFLRERDSV